MPEHEILPLVVEMKQQWGKKEASGAYKCSWLLIYSWHEFYFQTWYRTSPENPRLSTMRCRGKVSLTGNKTSRHLGFCNWPSWIFCSQMIGLSLDLHLPRAPHNSQINEYLSGYLYIYPNINYIFIQIQISIAKNLQYINSKLLEILAFVGAKPYMFWNKFFKQ